METRRKRCLRGTHGDPVHKVLIKQEVELQMEDSHPTDLVNQQLKLDVELLPTIKTEEDIMSINIETKRKTYLEGATGEKVPNGPIKQEADWLTQDSHAPDLPNKQSAVKMELLHAIKTEEHVSADAEARNDGYEYIITELATDQKSLDEKNDPESGFLAQEYKQRVPLQAYDQQAGVSVSDQESESCELSPSIYSKKSQMHCERIYRCELCPRSFRKKRYLKGHLITHIKDRERAFRCQSCESAFYTKSHLLKHMRTHSGESCNCEVCGAPFTQKSSLDIHMLRLHTEERTRKELKLHEEDETANCAEESKQSPLELIEEQQARVSQSEAYGLSSDGQQKSSPAQGEGAYKCEYCLRCFKKKKYLTHHMITHAQDRKRKFACHLCESAFYAKCDLARHVRVHRGATYNCQLCGAGFTQTGNLKAHMLRQHPKETQQLTADAQTSTQSSQHTTTELGSEEVFFDDDEGPNRQESQQSALQSAEKQSLSDNQSCELCLKIYPKELIRTHIRLEHCERLFKCELCPRSFKTAANLKRHMNTHAKDRKREFACDFCEKAFFTKQHLALHRDIHAVASLSCEVCGRPFTRKGNLKAHMLNQHSGENQLLL